MPGEESAHCIQDGQPSAGWFGSVLSSELPSLEAELLLRNLLVSACVFGQVRDQGTKP